LLHRTEVATYFIADGSLQRIRALARVLDLPDETDQDVPKRFEVAWGDLEKKVLETLDTTTSSAASRVVP
jgi:hypothetical protein